MSANHRKPFVGGNWKANGNEKSNAELIKILNEAKIETEKVDVVIAPPAIYIPSVQSQLRKDIGISAQNCYTESGAFTGEISVDMLKDLKIHYVILGHSERRHIFGETDLLIAQKIVKALKAGLTVIWCIGEQLITRESNKTEQVLEEQLKLPAEMISKESTDLWKNVVLAYEPVWAIGTGKTATPKQAQETHEFIRKWLADNVNQKVANETRIIYGGSVKASNSDELFSEKDIDGFLVGGASLNAEFINIISSAAK
jgi:triosephosphate isomerase